MTDFIKDRTIALAGLFQSVRLVQQTARGEPRDKEMTAASIGSIFNTNPATAVDVYGDIEAIRGGLEILVQQLGNDNKRRDMELTRYAVTLMHLEHKLSRKPGMLETMRASIETCRQQIESDNEQHASVVATLAELYKHISTLQPRVLVNGEPTVLNNPDSKNMVRALLLAGIRSAVLLHQSGGTRLKLIFQRRKLFECARELLQDMCRTD
jgi:high frequency lysogenization protein